MDRNQNIREAVQRREERNRLVGGRESKRGEWRMGVKQGQSAQGHVGKRESFALYLFNSKPIFFSLSYAASRNMTLKGSTEDQNEGDERMERACVYVCECVCVKGPVH